MGYTLSYRTCRPLSPEQEAVVRSAVEVFNQGRDWVLAVRRDERDGRLVCAMEPCGGLAAGGPQPWPGPYEAKCLLDGLCDVSRACAVDWEIHDTYGTRPVGVIRGGVCREDHEAMAESRRNMLAARRPGAGG